VSSYIDGEKPSARKIVHTVRKNNITKPAKVSNLSSTVSIETEYLHGQVSLEGVCVGLAQNFVGTNNINLIHPDGSFGNRSITEAAASRYIFTYKEPIMDLIFRKEDDSVLIRQEFEGSVIEPRFFVPIVPMLLINGSEGIGNGFAQKILPRDIRAILPEIESYLKKGKFKSEFISVYYKGFLGTVERVIKKDGVVAQEIFGKFEKSGRASVLITELPIGYDLAGYIKELDELEEDKVIKSYTDKAKDLDSFCIEVKVYEEFFNLELTAQYDKLKLVKRVVENWTCMGRDNIIEEFKSEMEVLKAYCDIRIEFYELRRMKMVTDLRQRAKVLQNRFCFVQSIIEGEIPIHNRPKADIIEDLANCDYMLVDGSYQYLIGMPIHSMTSTTMDELQKEIDEIAGKIDELESTTPHKLWLMDLKQLVAKLP
jgi:DNA topoisomerase-2